MQYTYTYDSPLGKMIMIGNQTYLTDLFFEDEAHAPKITGEVREDFTGAFEVTKLWLDMYFKGQKPFIMPPIELKGTEFRMHVWRALEQIPYGTSTTYGELGWKIAELTGQAKMSAQAIGGAVGHNPISIIIPCHRVLGKDGKLTGYAGGIDRKRALLDLEGITYKG